MLDIEPDPVELPADGDAAVGAVAANQDDGIVAIADHRQFASGAIPCRTSEFTPDEP